MELETEVVVVGAGAAGLMAAWRASRRGRRTLLLEKNNKIGVKILMSGGTRCNVTHDTDERGIAGAFGRNGRFLLSPLSKFGPRQIVELLASRGVATKTESTGKIFPVSNKAIDVRNALLDLTREAGTRIVHPFSVETIQRENNRFLVSGEGRSCHADSVIIATGGKSYPGCGTVGDGYAWAESFGHRIVPTFPSLAPIVCGEQWVADLKGITLPDVKVSVVDEFGKRLGDCRDSLLLTHFGLSGPAAMNVSRYVELQPEIQKKIQLDFAADEHREALLQRLREVRQSNLAKPIGAIPLCDWPRRFWENLLKRSSITPNQKFSEISKAALVALTETIKATPLSVAGTRGFPKAEVTAGGVSLKEVDSSTMQSKLQDHLYFAGEVLDLDGPIGGYNFQAAFSTGFVAGENA